MFEFQSQLIFPTHAVPEAGPLPPDSTRLQVQGAEGHALHGVHIPPEDRESGSKTLILGFGGNAWNGEDVASYLHELFPAEHVVAFHYRGYAPSAGSPSAEGLIADAPLVFDAAVDAVAPERTIAVGFSIGSGVAAQLSSLRKLDGLILVTPFDSLKAVAQSMYPWLPIGPFFKHEFDAVGALGHTTGPVAIIAAERDEIVPSERTAALRALVPSLAFDRTIPRAGHNDIYARSDFHEAMREALAAVSG
jgi:pimeloyl-ACP methyl ester carboxylesterase